MKLCVLGSGSKGNAVLIQAGQTRILIDAGFSTRVLARRLSSIGVDPESIEAVVVTHEHADHAKGAAAGATKWGWQVYATAGTGGACIGFAELGARSIPSNGAFAIGDIDLHTVTVSHDAEEPVAIIATGKETGVRAAIIYDLGVLTEPVRRAIEGVEILVLESNYDVDMLRFGPYPPSVQRRIAGREGHLSNRAAASAAETCAHRGLAHVVLAHLSDVNNTPRIATDSMQRALRRTPFRGQITIGEQDQPSRPIAAARSCDHKASQLSLGL